MMQQRQPEREQDPSYDNQFSTAVQKQLYGAHKL